MDSVAPGSVMRLAAIWRHPVKSFQGESPAEAYVDADALRGDRCWGVRDEETGRILTGRREPRLLLAAATLTSDGEPEVVLPSGARHRGTGPAVDAALSRWLDRPVSLVEAGRVPAGEAEMFADATDDASDTIAWTMPAGRFVDLMPLLVLTTASLRAGAALHPDGEWHPRRFRPNLLVEAAGDDWLEDAWCGHPVEVGSVVVTPQAPCSRCTMVTRGQPELARDLEVYKTLARYHGGTFGVWSDVQVPGLVRVGDPVTVATPS